MKKNKGETTTLIAAVGAVLVALALVLSNLAGQLQTLKNAEEHVALGSVSVTSEYIATSTAQSSAYGALITGDKYLVTGKGTLGSVVILGANTGIINIYNATTSSILKRASTKATSTILIASIPASMAAGTYTFDVQFTDGLFIDLVSGIMPTTTVTYRR